MGYKLKLDLPNYGKGVEVYLDGLGLFENGKEYEISNEDADAFRVTHQKYIEDRDPETGIVKSVEYEPGPTVQQYFKDREGLTISSIAKTKKASDSGSNSSGSQSSTADANTGGTDPVDPEGNKDAADGSGEGSN